MYKQIGSRKIHIAAYKVESLAWAAHSREIGRKVILGDDSKYWVVSNRDASILIGAGYQLAERP